MEILARKGIEDHRHLSFILDPDDLQNLLLAPYVINIHRNRDLIEPFLTANQDILEAIEAFYLCPLRVGDELVGLLVIGERFSGGEYSDEDMQILAMMSQQLSVAVHNHKLFSRLGRKVDENRSLYENLRQIYQDTIQAFAVAIDAKDEYTQGHSARVAQYAVAIGEELGLSGNELEGLRLAGLLHDIGKITVDSSIIRKKDHLDPLEIKQMHRHPSVGYEILSHIKFPWGDLSKLARHHHEKVDGKGYPDGLQGEELLLGARIITLGDSFDAMTSNRPYRRQIGLEETLREIKRCTGSQFDPHVVRTLFRVLEKELSGVIDNPKILSCLKLKYDSDRLLQVLREVNQPFRSAANTVSYRREQSGFEYM
jgi:putative nucleotidyltransferase with HDIG domain